MPWTRNAVKFLLSKGSPLKPAQKTKMVGELYADPSMGHMKKMKTEAHSYDHTRTRAKVVSRYS